MLGAQGALSSLPAPSALALGWSLWEGAQPVLFTLFLPNPVSSLPLSAAVVSERIMFCRASWQTAPFVDFGHWGGQDH